MGVLVIFIGGVCGVGKTQVGKECSKQLVHACFLDADDFHSVENKQKMQRGIPLSDEDRKPWLENLVKAIGEKARDYSLQKPANSYFIFCACSVLKFSYRQYLRNSLNTLVEGCTFILLTAKPQVLLQRLNARQGHFMSSTLLSSQLEALELLTEEERALGDKEYETSEQSLPELVSSIIQQLATQY